MAAITGAASGVGTTAGPAAKTCSEPSPASVPAHPTNANRPRTPQSGLYGCDNLHTLNTHPFVQVVTTMHWRRACRVADGADGADGKTRAHADAFQGKTDAATSIAASWFSLWGSSPDGQQFCCALISRTSAETLPGSWLRDLMACDGAQSPAATGAASLNPMPWDAAPRAPGVDYRYARSRRI